MATKRKTRGTSHKGKPKKRGAGSTPAPRSSDLSKFVRSHPRRSEILRRAALRQPPIGLESYESRRRRVRKILLAHDVPMPVVDEICAMNPTQHYIVAIYGYMVSREDIIGETLIRQAVFVGTGLRMWSRLVGYVKHADIVLVQIDEILATDTDHPLWDGQSVETVDGKDMYGLGHWQDWKDRKKIGRPKKAGGGMNAAQRAKQRKRNKAIRKRDQALAGRIKALESAGQPIEADKLRRRAEAARKR